MQVEEIKFIIESEMQEAVMGIEEASSPKALWIHKEYVKNVCDLLRTNDKTYFDSLSCLTGLDNGVEQNTLEIIYNIYSIPNDFHLALKVKLDRENPEVDSVATIWKTADWHEREAYDLLGICFKGHSDLRRILLPEDWDGHPLRKDYREQEIYHDVKVKY